MAPGRAGPTHIAPESDEVDMGGIAFFGRDEASEDLMSPLIGAFLGDPAESFRHAQDMGISGKDGTLTRKEQHAGRRFGSDAIERHQKGTRLFDGNATQKIQLQ
jgi:hypothetical protein